MPSASRIFLNVVTSRDQCWRLTTLLKGLTEQSQKQIRSDLWRKNRRSAIHWGGGLALLVSVSTLLFVEQLAMRWAMIVAVVMVAVPGILGLTLLRVAHGRHLGESFAERNICIACGYDLRATPERCPECGTEPRAAA